MTLEERVQRLENFTGDIDKIISVYANSIQEICDKYLNLLYIENYDPEHPNYLTVDGFLSELTTVNDLPKNVMFNIRASHNFAYDGDDHSSKIRFTRIDPDTNEKHILDVPLKKYDIANPGNLMFLEPDDFLQGILYGVYINSQGIAIISSNDAGTVALEAVSQIRSQVAEIAAQVSGMSTSQEVTELNVTNASVNNLTISEVLTLVNSVVLPNGSTCSTPVNDKEIANKEYVDTAITSKIAEYHNTYHIFGTVDPATILNDAPEKAIYYKY